jgi:hypothetical protein
VPNLMSLFHCLRSNQRTRRTPMSCEMFRNIVSC